MKVYLALPLAAAKMGNWHAERLTAAGFAVSSSWHQHLDGIDFPTDPELLDVRRRTLISNIHELVESDCILVDTTLGTPRATYGELGFALGIGLSAIWIQGKNAARCLWDAHPNVTIVGDMSSAIEALRKHP